jgi:anti-anti-sigma factor
MDHPYQQIAVLRRRDVFCVHLRHKNLDEGSLDELSQDILHLYNGEGARKIVLNLGPDDPFCLYSIFLAKLVHLQQKLLRGGGQMAIAHASPDVVEIFRVCGVEKLFRFFPDEESAVEGLSQKRKEMANSYSAGG